MLKDDLSNISLIQLDNLFNTDTQRKNAFPRSMRFFLNYSQITLIWGSQATNQKTQPTSIQSHEQCKLGSHRQ